MHQIYPLGFVTNTPPNSIFKFVCIPHFGTIASAFLRTTYFRIFQVLEVNQLASSFMLGQPPFSFRPCPIVVSNCPANTGFRISKYPY